MIAALKKPLITPQNIEDLLKTRLPSLMQAFYESQSTFLCRIYKRYGNIETANIILCFVRNVHLEIIRQREKDLNFNVSKDNFWKNFNIINTPGEKISSIVKVTGIPKETVRRKIYNLVNSGFLEKDKKNKSFYWNLNLKDKNSFFVNVNNETKNLSKFISKIVKELNFKINPKLIESEISSQFSFYWYHYLSCQLEWLKWWQLKLKDSDLLLIAMQATIPSLKYIEKNPDSIDLNDVFKIIGRVNKNEYINYSVSATSISDITGIPRASVIRKLDKLVHLGFLIRELKSKRYSINQTTDSRTKNIMSKENVSFTIKNFSGYIAIILNSLVQNKL